MYDYDAHMKKEKQKMCERGHPDAPATDVAIEQGELIFICDLCLRDYEEGARNESNRD